jgi:CDP-paratose 2-epimerase
MKVMVTGGCGFLGSHVCEYYIKKGAGVIAYDNMTKYELMRTGYVTDAARDYNRQLLKKLGVTLVRADVCDFARLEMAARGCDFIIHTAAQPAMTISWESPELDFATNVQGGFNVLEVARRLRIPMVNCATIHVYGNKINEALREGDSRYIRKPAAIDEGHPTVEGTLTPLHASKRSIDLYVQAYNDTYKLELASFRLTGIYGPQQFGGDDHGWVANFVIRAVLGMPITIYGTGKQLRDILYATDVAESFDAFYRSRKPGIYNIGGGEKASISLLECIELIKEITARKPEVRFGPQRLGDLLYFVCDISKARRELGWEPRVSNRDGVTRLIDWVRKNERLFRGGQVIRE